MLVASLYVLLFPTLMSAVTGYASNSQGGSCSVWSFHDPHLLIWRCRSGFIRDVDDNLLPWSSLLPVVYVIHDGWRIGLHKNSPVRLHYKMGVMMFVDVLLLVLAWTGRWSGTCPKNAFCCGTQLSVSHALSDSISNTIIFCMKTLNGMVRVA
jgi:hypothetical protein